MYNLIVILGPTASGKTSFAASLANYVDGEIISADSRQVYRSMNLGTGKDYDDYTVEGRKIPFHLIDICEPGYKYNVYEFQKDFFSAFDGIQKRGRWPLLCGGTGLYIESVLKHYKMLPVPFNEELRKDLKDKALAELEIILASFRRPHNSTDSDTVERALRAIEIEKYYHENPDVSQNLPYINPLIIGMEIDRSERREKITARLKQRLNEGMIEEVKTLMQEGIASEDLIYYGLEYKYITLYLKNELSYEAMLYELNKAIHRFAKRQMTWFRKMEREGTVIHWLNVNIPVKKRIDMVRNLLNNPGV